MLLFNFSDNIYLCINVEYIHRRGYVRAHLPAAAATRMYTLHLYDTSVKPRQALVCDRPSRAISSHSFSRARQFTRAINGREGFCNFIPKMARVDETRAPSAIRNFAPPSSPGSAQIDHRAILSRLARRALILYLSFKLINKNRSEKPTNTRVLAVKNVHRCK